MHIFVGLDKNLRLLVHGNFVDLDKKFKEN
jgi:hypothetical protein